MPDKITGTIFTSLKNNTISDKTPIYKDMKPIEAYEYVIKDYSVHIFWTVWIILIGACVFGFYYLDNRWLD